jgi:UDP-N-acetylmuramoyl-L-alanyl-D-glutamate--2,6-diaminopimelate ligase
MAEPAQSATLSDLGLAEGARVIGDPGTRVAGLAADSRAVRPGYLFAALPGARVHGAAFLTYALGMQAAAILTDGAGAAMAGRLSVPVVVHPDPRRALAIAAARWFRSQPRVMVAVTGTNGKTSVASFTRQIWSALGHRAVNLGTVGVEGAVTAPLAHTTPEPIALHRLLAGLAAQGVSHAAMEASSHGLDQRRLDGVVLRAAGFTNLTRDHLDYHGSEEAYAAAKLGLFDRVLPVGGAAVVNFDDPLAPVVRHVATGRGQRIIGVGADPLADLRVEAAEATPSGQTLRLFWQGEAHRVTLPLVGRFQAANALVAAGLAIGAGEAAAAVLGVLPALGGVRGRLELAGRLPNGAAVYVDYAHTPDALATVLAALRPHARGRIVCVFGAGGDRDPGKRPLMGAAVAVGADLAIVTDDNPRSEEPAAIRAAVLAGCPGAREVGDRAEAIAAGVVALGPGDLLLIAGKGHETGQTVAGTVLPFDDLEVARAAIRAVGGGP